MFLGGLIARRYFSFFTIVFLTLSRRNFRQFDILERAVKSKTTNSEEKIFNRTFIFFVMLKCKRSLQTRFIARLNALSTLELINIQDYVLPCADDVRNQSRERKKIEKIYRQT